MFDRRWLQERMGAEFTSDLDYLWHRDARTHLEVEAAAFALWDDLGPAANALTVERLFDEIATGSTLLRAVSAPSY